MKELRELVRWAQTQRWDGKVLHTAYFKDSAIVERLWIEPPFQIERVTFHPYAFVHEHAHPSVDTWDIVLEGSGVITVGDRIKFIDARFTNPGYIKRGVWHGGLAGPKGGQSLTVQQWHFKEPTSLLNDWLERKPKCLTVQDGQENQEM